MQGQSRDSAVRSFGIGYETAFIFAVNGVKILVPLSGRHFEVCIFHGLFVRGSKISSWPEIRRSLGFGDRALS